MWGERHILKTECRPFTSWQSGFLKSCAVSKRRKDGKNMLKIDLNGRWKMKNTLDSGWIDGTVPGSVYGDLLGAGKIEDPFYRDNEDKIREISRFDFEYQRNFYADADLSLILSSLSL